MDELQNLNRIYKIETFINLTYTLKAKNLSKVWCCLPLIPVCREVESGIALEFEASLSYIISIRLARELAT